MKLENLIQTCIDRGTFNSDSRNEMLRTKLWSGISDNDSSLNTILKKLEDMNKRMTEVEKEVKRSRSNSRPLTQNEPNSQSGPRSYNNTENRGRNFRSFGTGRFRNNPQRGNYYRGYKQYRRTNGDLNG